MKQFNINKKLLQISIFIFLTVLALNSCKNDISYQNEKSDKALLQITSVFDYEQSRTALTSFDISELSSIELCGEKNGNRKQLTTAKNIEELYSQIIPIETGTWNLELSACSGTVTFNDKIENVKITSFSDTSDENYLNKVSFNLKITSYGTKENTGKLKVKVSFPKENDVCKIKAGLFTLYESDENEIEVFYPFGKTEVADFQLEEIEIKTTNAQESESQEADSQKIDSQENKNLDYIVYEKSNIPVGKYLLKVFFYGDDKETLLLNTFNEIAIIADSHLSVSENTLSSLNKVYHLSYNFNMGQLNLEEPQTLTTSYCYNTSFPLVTPPTLYRNGYTFGGWYTTEDFQENTIITEIQEETTKDVSVYAKWNPITYFIAYNYGEGGIAPEASNPISYTPDDETFTLQNPTNKNESLFFAGWYISEQYEGSKIEKIEKYSYGNLKLYAKWSSGNFKITYNLMDTELNKAENSKNNPAEYDYESEDIQLSPALRSGCIFQGWYTTKDYEEGTEITTIKSHSTGDIILYAKWNTSAYKIEYQLGNERATNPESNPVGYTVESDNIVFVAPANPGYEFKGWYTDENLTEEIKGIKTGSTGDIKVYAKWEIVTYTIEYVLNNGTDTTESSKNPKEFTCESSELTLYTPEREGYDFDGWYTTADFSENTKMNCIPHYTVGNLTLYAKWNLIEYNINYVLNDSHAQNVIENPATYTIISDDIVFEAPVNNGYNFKGWFKDQNYSKTIEKISKGSLGEISVYAKWEIINYNITYDLNGGQLSNSITLKEKYTVVDSDIDLPSPEKTGYNFDGWKDMNSAQSSSTLLEKIESGNYKDFELKAVYTPIVYDIEYNLDGGKNNSLNPSSYTIESTTIQLANPTKKDYTFIGWYTSPDYAENKKITEISSGSYGKIELFAKFEVIQYNGSITVEAFTFENKLQEMPEPVISDNTITFTAPKGFTSYNWYIDFEKVASTRQFVFDISTTSIEGGNHTVELLVTDSDGNYYSATYELHFRK